MAKENVTFIERHVEKLVIGVAGAVLLGAVAMYLVSSPNVVEGPSGEPVGPNELFGAARDNAESLRTRITSATPEAPQQPQEGGAPADNNLSPYADPRLAATWDKVFVPFHHAVPDVGDMSFEGGKVEIATIIAPGKPVALTGKAYAPLPDQVVVAPGTSDIPEPLPPLSRDYRWVSVFAGFSRKDQRERFRKAGYGRERELLTIAAVEAERQELLPDGSEGEVRIVRSWRPVQVLDGKKRVELISQDRILAMAPEDIEAMNAWRSMLEDEQEQLMRPPFQEFLADRYWAWTAPEKVPGFDFTWEEWGVTLPPLIEKERRGAAADGAAAAADAARRARADLKKAQEAFDKKEFEKADELLQPLLSMQELSPGDRTAAQELQRKLEPEMQRLLREQERRNRQNEGLDLNLVDTEPLWINDTTVMPGKTYRYRVRILAFNQFAGVSIELKDPQDAARIVLTGDWSEWSDPVRVQQENLLLLTGTNKEKATARLEVFQWKTGSWESALTEAGIGDKIVATRGSNTFPFEGVILDIDYNRTFAERAVDGTGRIRFTDRPSDAITLMLADGDVEERVRAEDVDIARVIRDEIKKTKELEQAAAGGGIQPRMGDGPGPRPRTTGTRGRRPPIYGGPMGGPMGGPRRPGGGGGS